MAGLGIHQVDRGVAAAGAALSELADASLLGLDDIAVGDSLVALSQLESRVAELKLRVLAHAAEVHVEETGGATTAATWFAHATRTTVRAARRSARLADALTDFSVLRAGMAAGAVNVEQAEVIARSLMELPTHLDQSIRLRAEQTLVDLAADHDALDLRRLGERILDLIAPEIGEAQEAHLLAAAERAAEKATTLTLTPDGDGKVRGRFTLPELHAGMLRKLLTALVVHPVPTSTREVDTEPLAALHTRMPRRPSSEEMGHAFCDLLERLDGTQVPTVGGTGATVVVTMTLETLRGGLAAATVDTGDRITPHTARRLACEAGIIPVVLGSKSQVLDQGRTKRLFTKAQHLALTVRDRQCTAKGCTTPAWFCHAHHDDPWSHGGRTDLDKGRLLCPSHHRRIHDPDYAHRITRTNQVEFTKRT